MPKLVKKHLAENYFPEERDVQGRSFQAGNDFIYSKLDVGQRVARAWVIATQHTRLVELPSA
jgi:hypothetical protein